MNFLPLTACHKHPHERVVGICSVCLAQRLTSLARSRYLPAELAGNASLGRQLDGSPLAQRIQKQTIAEEEDPAIVESTNEAVGLASSKPPHLLDARNNGASNSKGINGTLVQAPKFVKTDGAYVSLLSDDAEIALDGQESLSNCEKKESLVNDKLSAVHSANTEIAGGSQCKTITGNAELSSANVAKCKRSKSSGVLRTDSLKHVPRILSHREGVAVKQALEKANGRRASLEKVSLRSLFDLDDAEGHEIGCSESALARDENFSSNYTQNAEEVPKETFEDTVRTYEKRDDLGTRCYHSHDLLCCSYRACSSSLSPWPVRIKQSLLLNSLLCRRTRDGNTPFRDGVVPTGKASRVHEFKHRIDTECAQASVHDGLIRATYIASESRVPSMRRHRSKIGFHAARSSFSSSEPTSPGPFYVDSRSERKFNLLARALAIDVPSIFQASQDELAASSSGEKWSSCQEGHHQAPSVSAHNDLSMDWIAMNPLEMRNKCFSCDAECKTDSETQPISNIGGEEEGPEHKSRLITTPVELEITTLDMTVPSLSRSIKRSWKTKRCDNDDATETELIKVCERIVERHYKWSRPECRPMILMSPRTSSAAAIERPFEGESGIQANCRSVSNAAEGNVTTKDRGSRQGKSVMCTGDSKMVHGESEKAKEGATGHGGAEQAEYQESGKEEERVETDYGKAGQTKSESTQQPAAEAQHGGADQAGRWELREADPVQGLETERGTAGEAEESTEGGQVDCGRLASYKSEGVQQQNLIWEAYSKSGKAAVSSSRTSCRWPPSSSSVRIASDHPLLRFYLTPFRSSGWMRSRHHQSPKRHFWPLVFM